MSSELLTRSAVVTPFSSERAGNLIRHSLGKIEENSNGSRPSGNFSASIFNNNRFNQQMNSENSKAGNAQNHNSSNEIESDSLILSHTNIKPTKNP